ncbi:hypothetical protein [Bradyrhizobium genosp. P]|uniref:hypothetical protein n=1 Tax=Bradyrhizobium genosp. P TaxID=83641 RepID=UPI003CEDB1FB
MSALIRERKISCNSQRSQDYRPILAFESHFHMTQPEMAAAQSLLLKRSAACLVGIKTSQNKPLRRALNVPRKI